MIASVDAKPEVEVRLEVNVTATMTAASLQDKFTTERLSSHLRRQVSSALPPFKFVCVLQRERERWEACAREQERGREMAGEKGSLGGERETL